MNAAGSALLPTRPTSGSRRASTPPAQPSRPTIDDSHGGASGASRPISDSMASRAASSSASPVGQRQRDRPVPHHRGQARSDPRRSAGRRRATTAWRQRRGRPRAAPRRCRARPVAGQPPPPHRERTDEAGHHRRVAAGQVDGGQLDPGVALDHRAPRRRACRRWSCPWPPRAARSRSSAPGARSWGRDGCATVTPRCRRRGCRARPCRRRRGHRAPRRAARARHSACAVTRVRQ